MKKSMVKKAGIVLVSGLVLGGGMNVPAFYSNNINSIAYASEAVSGKPISFKIKYIDTTTNKEIIPSKDSVINPGETLTFNMEEISGYKLDINVGFASETVSYDKMLDLSEIVLPKVVFFYVPNDYVFRTPETPPINNNPIPPETSHSDNGTSNNNPETPNTGDGKEEPLIAPVPDDMTKLINSGTSEDTTAKKTDPAPQTPPSTSDGTVSGNGTSNGSTTNQNVPKSDLMTTATGSKQGKTSWTKQTEPSTSKTYRPSTSNYGQKSEASSQSKTLPRTSAVK